MTQELPYRENLTSGNTETEVFFHPGGRIIYARQGGSAGTTKMEYTLDQTETPSNWSDVADGLVNTELTADGAKGIEWFPCRMRVSVTGITGTITVAIGGSGIPSTLKPSP